MVKSLFNVVVVFSYPNFLLDHPFISYLEYSTIQLV